jgi:hypothetical protein
MTPRKEYVKFPSATLDPALHLNFQLLVAHRIACKLICEFKFPAQFACSIRAVVISKILNSFGLVSFAADENMFGIHAEADDTRDRPPIIRNDSLLVFTICPSFLKYANNQAKAEVGGMHYKGKLYIQFAPTLSCMPDTDACAPISDKYEDLPHEDKTDSEIHVQPSTDTVSVNIF